MNQVLWALALLVFPNPAHHSGAATLTIDVTQPWINWAMRRIRSARWIMETNKEGIFFCIPRKQSSLAGAGPPSSTASGWAALIAAVKAIDPSTPRAAKADPDTVNDNYCKWAAAQPPLKGSAVLQRRQLPQSVRSTASHRLSVVSRAPGPRIVALTMLPRFGKSVLELSCSVSPKDVGFRGMMRHCHDDGWMLFCGVWCTTSRDWHEEARSWDWPPLCTFH